jgi:hypothetical protein
VYVSRWSRQNESTPAGVLVIGGVDVAFRVDLLFARKVPYCDARTAVERVSGALRLGGATSRLLADANDRAYDLVSYVSSLGVS